MYIHIFVYSNFLYQHLAFGCSKMFSIAQVVEAASPRAPDESHMGGSTAGDTATDAKDFFYGVALGLVVLPSIRSTPQVELECVENNMWIYTGISSTRDNLQGYIF